MTAAAKHGKRITHPSFLFSLYLSAPRAIILKPTPSPSFLVGSYGRTSLGERGLREEHRSMCIFDPAPSFAVYNQGRILYCVLFTGETAALRVSVCGCGVGLEQEGLKSHSDSYLSPAEGGGKKRSLICGRE